MLSYNGKIHYFYGHVQQQTVQFPEGALFHGTTVPSYNHRCLIQGIFQVVKSGMQSSVMSEKNVQLRLGSGGLKQPEASKDCGLWYLL